MARVLADDVALNYNGTNYYLSFVKANVYDASGNNNGRLDPGETANLTALLRNIGGANFIQLSSSIYSSDPYITISDNSGYFGYLPIDSIKENISDPYTVSVNANCPQGHIAQFRMVVTEGWYLDTIDFSLVIGSYHYLVWNPDVTPSSGQTIHNTLTANGFTGAITTNLLAEPTLDVYRSIFICCGVYPNNYRISANGAEATAIINYLNNGGRVYLEGGEVWYYDPTVGGHNFCSLFGLVGVSDGSSDMGPVVGVTNTFTQGMNFNYSGENNYMDRINATTGFIIFRDGDNNYNCGVAYNSGTYRTIGVSFEFGSLVDGASPSTKKALADSIMKFFGITLSSVEEPEVQNPNRLVNNLTISPTLAKIGSSIQIKYNPRMNTNTQIKIFNATGCCVKTIPLKNDQTHYCWDGRDDKNQFLPTGIYFINLMVDKLSITKRVILVN